MFTGIRVNHWNKCHVTTMRNRFNFTGSIQIVFNSTGIATNNDKNISQTVWLKIDDMIDGFFRIEFEFARMRLIDWGFYGYLQCFGIGVLIRCWIKCGKQQGFWFWFFESNGAVVVNRLWDLITGDFGLIRKEQVIEKKDWNRTMT